MTIYCPTCDEPAARGTHYHSADDPSYCAVRYECGRPESADPDRACGRMFRVHVEGACITGADDLCDLTPSGYCT